MRYVTVFWKTNRLARKQQQQKQTNNFLRRAKMQLSKFEANPMLR